MKNWSENKTVGAGVLLIVISIYSLPGCLTYSPGNTATIQTSNPEGSAADAELMKKVKLFSSGIDENATTAWKELQSQPRDQLVNDLVRVSRRLPVGSQESVAVAFVLCNLDYEYDTNKEVLIRALEEKPPFENTADWAAELIDRLIDRNDKSLLPNLFAATAWADGAMSASLSGYFSKHFKRGPRIFLLQLKNQPKNIRDNVYSGIANDELLTEQDIIRIQKILRSVSKDSETAAVAKEMLLIISRRKNST